TEVAAYLEAHTAERDADGHALVVRNGKGRTRSVTIGSGTIAVSAPRVNDRRIDTEGQRCKFTDAAYQLRQARFAYSLLNRVVRTLKIGPSLPFIAQGTTHPHAPGCASQQCRSRFQAAWTERNRARVDRDAAVSTPRCRASRNTPSCRDAP